MRGGDFEFLLQKSLACFAVSGQPYLCIWKNRPRFTPQTTSRQRKLTAGNNAQTAPTVSPAVARSSRLQVQRYGYQGCGKDCRVWMQPRAVLYAHCARYGKRLTKHGGRCRFVASDGGVRRAEVNPSITAMHTV